MGAHHQMSIIAKIGRQYRILAAVHHQSLDCEGPLLRCLRLLEVMGSESNRTPIQQVCAACETSEDFWEGKEFQAFPFIATCWWRLPLTRLKYTNDEFTRRLLTPRSAILTITKALHLLMLRIWRVSDDDERDNPQGGQDEDVQNEYHSLVELFDTYQLVDVTALRSLKTQKVKKEEPSIVDDEHSADVQSSLRDQSMDQLIDTRADDPDFDFGTFADAQEVPGFAVKLWSRLITLANANQACSKNVIRCLQYAFDGEATLDFSPFANIRAEYLAEALSKMLEGDSVKSLDISHLQQLIEKDMDSMFHQISSLEILHILGMSPISLQCVARLCSRNHALKAIYHTGMYQRPFAQDMLLSNLMPLLKALSSIKNIFLALVPTEPWLQKPNPRKNDGITIDWQRCKMKPSSPFDRDRL